jgi:nondiscriminating aspartyl-tRNA synthetase
MSSLKKALNSLKPKKKDGNPSDSEASSVSGLPLNELPNELEASKTEPVSGTNGRQREPSQASRASGTFNHRAETFPQQAPPSPRSSGIFSRGSIHGRNSIAVGRTHSPIRAVKEKLGLTSDHSSEDGETPLNREGNPMSKNQLRKHEKQAEKEKKAEIAEEREKAVEEQKKRMAEQAAKEETAEQKALYGVLPINNYAGEWKHLERVDIGNITAKDVGKEIVFRARIHAMRKLSTRLVFFLLRQSTRTVQGVLEEHGNITKYFMYWAERLDVESIVLVRGIVQQPAAKEGEVTGASIHDWELSIHQLQVEGSVSQHLPYNPYEGEISTTEIQEDGDTRHAVPFKVRMHHKVVDLRTTASQAIFRIQSGIGFYFRDYLDSQGFIEIHTPKLQGGATESGASVFKLDYFGRPAFLAQSPQLAKQMSISADFGRVYEIGAVFRAENSNTHRHLTEYTGLDLEMAIDEHYHEVLRVLDNTFKHIFTGIYKKYRHEIDIVKRQYPHEDLVWLEQTPIIPFADAIRMLNETGWKDEHGNELPLDEDLGTRDEIQLGRVIKEKYKTDYYVLDKFPVSARPFYAMPDPFNPKITNSFDIFLRGQEILSGGQRIHDAPTLLKNLEAWNIDPRSMEDYVQGFEWGAPPHGGGGIGLERMLMLLLNLGDIRNGTLFHRDPRSFPLRVITPQIRHPEASTLHPPWEGKDRAAAQIDFQPLEKLIANYGDASNTSWLEPRTKIWRDHYTGAAVGYVPQDGFAITVGDPLCDPSQYVKTIAGYLQHVKKETNLRVLWLLVGPEIEDVLASRFNWRSFSVVAEQRLDPSSNPAAHDHELQRKIRHAEKEGVKLIDIPIGKEVPQEFRDKVDARVKDWLANRKGKQVHLTNIHPWQDIEHRQYHYAIDKDGTIVGLIVMAQLSPIHGWQVKYSLDFPGAPGGAIEYLVLHSLKQLAGDGATNVTFGGGASSTFTPGHNMNKTKVKMLSKAYNAIVNELKLTNKSEFREKLGAQDDPIYVCYPPHGLGPMAVKAILSFFEDD